MASNELCKAPGCDKPVYAKGYCNKHYNQIRVHGKLRPDLERTRYDDGDRTCSEEGCEGEVIAKGLCMAHYQQYRRAKEMEKQIVEDTPPVRRRVVRRRA